MWQQNSTRNYSLDNFRILQTHGTYIFKKDHIQNQLLEHHLIQKNIQIQNSLKKLHTLFIHYKVAEFYPYFLYTHLIKANQNDIQNTIIDEIQNLKDKKSHYQKIIQSIQARQACLIRISRHLVKKFIIQKQNLFNYGTQDHAYNLFRNELNNYRKLTSYCIKQIQEWKQSLLQISAEQEYISFIFKGKDYLIKLLNDIQFISCSFLSTHVKFSSKNDPFLLKPTLQTVNNQYSELFKIEEKDKQLFLERLNYLAAQRVRYLTKKETQKEDKIKQIEKIYHNKSLIPQIHFKKLSIDPKNIKRHELGKKKQEQIKQIDFVESQFNDQMKIKSRDNHRNSQSMKRIKEVFSESSKKNTLNQYKLILPVRRNTPEKMQKIKHRFHLHSTSNNELAMDFQQLTHKKQLELMKQDLQNSRKIRPIKIIDTLTHKPLLQNNDKYDKLIELQKKLQKSSPYNLEQYIINNKLNSNKSELVLNQNNSKTKNSSRKILEYNQIMREKIRQQVINEIQNQSKKKNQVQNQSKSKQQQLKIVIHNEIDSRVLQHVKQYKQQKKIGRQTLADSFNKKQLFGYSKIQKPKEYEKLTELQNELKKEMQLKLLRQVQAQLKRRTQLDKLHKQKQIQCINTQNEIQKIKDKEQLQKKYDQFQKIQKARIKRQQIKFDEERKAQIQAKMHQIIKNQREYLKSYNEQQKKQLQDEMKKAMKTNILQSLKEQKQAYYDEKDKKEQIKLKQQQFRDQVRKKLEKQYEVSEIIQKYNRKQQLSNKLKTVLNENNTAIIQPQQTKRQIINEQQYQTARSRLLQIPSDSKLQELSKKRLRQQFQCQLLGFKDRNKNEKDIDQFIKSKISKLESEEQEIKKIQIEQQEQRKKMALSQFEKQEDDNDNSNQFVPYSDKQKDKIDVNSNQDKIIVEQQENILIQQKDKILSLEDEKKRIKLQMSYDQYLIYKKKKELIDSRRDMDQQKRNKNQEKDKIARIIQQFQIMPILEVSNNYQEQKSQQIILENPLKNEMKSQSDQTIRQKVLNQGKKESIISQFNEIISKQSEIQEPKHKKRFITSDEDSDEEYEFQKKLHQNTKSRKSFRKKKNKQIQEQQLVAKPIEEDKKIQINNIIQKNTFVKKRQIKQQQLLEFLNKHFQNIPKILRKINPLKKDELIKILQNQKSFIILEYIKDNYSIGQIIFINCQKTNKNRIIKIVHIGSYQQNDLIELLLNCTRYFFTQDPCQQITLSFFYNKSVQQQMQFINSFFKKFDPYGAVLEKSINNQLLQRKHILRRMIGQIYQKEINKSYLGNIQINIQMLTTDSDINFNKTNINKSIGYYGIMSYYLSNHVKQEIFDNFINQQTFNKDSLKYLSELSKNIIKNNPLLDQFVEHQFNNVLQLNLQLVKQGQETIKCAPNLQEQSIQVHRTMMKLNLQLAFNYVISKNNFKIEDDSYNARYLRYSPIKKYKHFLLKSTIFNTELVVLPCTNTKYKYVILSSLQFDTLTEKISLDVYLKLLLRNISEHSQGTWQHIWIPQYKVKNSYSIHEMHKFSKYSEYRESINLTYTNYIQSSLKIQPTHRDLFITPPFIFAILNSQIQKSMQGSPILIHRIQLTNMIDVVQSQKIIVENQN